MPPPAAGQSSRVGLKRRAIPEEVRKGVAFTRLENVDEALRAALLPKTSPAPAKMRPRATSGT